VVTLALYANALPNQFLVDDPAIIIQNTAVRDGAYGRILTEPYWPRAILGDVLYRPLMSMSYAVNWAISHEPWTFRLPTLLMHAGVCALVFALTRELFRNVAAAWIAALLFAFHPIHTEPLNPIVGRADVVSAGLMFGAMLIWWRDGKHQRGLVRPMAASLLLLAAAFSKESAVVVVAAMPLLDWYRRGLSAGSEPGWWPRRLVRCYLPMLVVVGALLAARQAVLGTVGGSTGIFPLDNPIVTPAAAVPAGESAFLWRWGTPLYTLAKSATMLFVPWPLRHDYSHPTITAIGRFSDPRLWYGVLWFVALIAVLVLSFRRHRPMFVAVGLAIIPYLIVSNFPVAIGTIFGERLLYAPSVGFCMAMGLLAATLLRPSRSESDEHQLRAPLFANLTRRHGIVLSGVAIALGVQAVMVVSRNADWRTWRTLAVSLPADERASFKVLSAYAELALQDGYEAYASGKVEEGIALFEQSLEYGVEARERAPNAWLPYRNMGRALYRLGRIDAAGDAFTRAIQLSDGGALAPLMLVDASEVFALLGRWCEARDALERASEHIPEWKILNNLADSLRRCPRGPADIPRAIDLARQAVAMDPAPCDGHDTLSRALHASGDAAAALAAAEAGLAACDPQDPARVGLQAWAEELRAGVR
jgi:hypothetical protein